MIADSRTVFATSSIKWEGVLVGQGPWTVQSTNTHSVLVVLSQVVLTVNYLQATLPGGAAWGSGSGGGLAARLAQASPCAACARWVGLLGSGHSDCG